MVDLRDYLYSNSYFGSCFQLWRSYERQILRSNGDKKKMKLKEKISDLVLKVSTYLTSVTSYIILIILIILAVFLVSRASVFGATIGLSWDKSEQTVMYNIYQSKIPGKYDKTNIIATTNNLNYDINILNTITTYWVVTAVDDTGKESAKSNQVNNMWWVFTCKWFKLNC